ncbi:hypothetical protein LKO27_08095 [Tessaracoccus sp. OS52]|uniref:LppU/SCO3897 family protein n=1 Tax=Tessaracoccus sp. OS52 TaxID=2886691 RepID=UPI001D1025A4|nr:hypothetical protein [Tessaracoccus sp. OS52]MCC2593367.1 hypothetical protein [Tessaracoccus sp. OS52]
MTQPPNYPGQNPAGQPGNQPPGYQQPQWGPGHQGTPGPGGGPNLGPGSYGQQSPAPAHHGQPPYGQQPPQGQQPVYVSGGTEAPGGRKSGAQKAKGVLGAIVSVVLIAVAGFNLWNRFTSDAALEVGNCLAFSGQVEDANHEEVDCGDAATFSFEVARVNDGALSCAPEYLSYTVTQERSESPEKIACLIENFASDTCYQVLPESDVRGYAVVDCSEAVAEFKVTQRHDAAGASCAEGEEPYAYEEPARTYCIGDPAA